MIYGAYRCYLSFCLERVVRHAKRIPTCVHPMAHSDKTQETRGPSQYKDCLSRYKDSRYKDETGPVSC